MLILTINTLYKTLKCKKMFPRKKCNNITREIDVVQNHDDNQYSLYRLCSVSRTLRAPNTCATHREYSILRSQADSSLRR